MKNRRLDCEIKPLVRSQAYLCSHTTVDSLIKGASSLFLANVAARIKEIHVASDETDRLGEDLKPREFTKCFANKPTQQTPISLSKYTLPAEMDNFSRKAISRERKEKACRAERSADGAAQGLPGSLSRALI